MSSPNSSASVFLRRFACVGAVILAFVLNLALVMAFWLAFVQNCTAVPTPEGLASLPYFAGCEVLDTTVSDADIAAVENRQIRPGKLHRDWVLYRDPQGTTMLVALEWNYYFPNYRILAKTAQSVSGEGTVSLSESEGFGRVSVTVENGAAVAKSVPDIFGIYMLMGHWPWGLAALALLLVEYAVFRLIRRRTPTPRAPRGRPLAA